MPAGKTELAPLFESFLRTGTPDALLDFLAAHSNLPGPRGNLELAYAFADAAARYAVQQAERLWALCQDMIAIGPEQAPVGDPREFIPFCGALGTGALGAAQPPYLEPALDALRKLASDPRWRMREGVAMGLQRLIAADPRRVIAALQGWIDGGSWLELRAVAAGVAEPALLRDGASAREALQLHESILERVMGAQDRRAEAFKILRQGLGYTLSVVVQAAPEAGFEWLARLVDTRDRDVLWIVRQNLKKNRLRRPYPEQVAALEKRLDLGSP